MSVTVGLHLSDGSNPKNTKLQVESNIYSTEHASLQIARSGSSVSIHTDDPHHLWRIASEADALARDLYERQLAQEFNDESE